jgi:hypothetical protein
VTQRNPTQATAASRTAGVGAAPQATAAPRTAAGADLPAAPFRAPAGSGAALATLRQAQDGRVTQRERWRRNPTQATAADRRRRGRTASDGSATRRRRRQRFATAADGRQAPGPEIILYDAKNYLWIL